MDRGDEAVKEWIKCSDESPLNGEGVLMSYNDLVMQGEYSNGKFYYPSSCAHVKGYCKCEEQEGITHWMPLPNPPSDYKIPWLDSPILPLPNPPNDND